MNLSAREHWSPHIDAVIRSRHYTWLPEGLGGKELPEAMATLIADIRHICRRTGIPWCQVVAEGRDLFDSEEKSLAEADDDSEDTSTDNEFPETLNEQLQPEDLKLSEVERGLLV